MNTRHREYLTLLPWVLLAACDSPTGPIPPETRSIVATVQVFDDEPQVDVPARVVAGQEFTVAVMTVGGGCVSKGVEKLEFRGLSVGIDVYDTEMFGAEACPNILKVFKHEVRLVFPRPGTGTVMIKVCDSQGEPLVIKQRVDVISWAPPPVMPIPAPKPKPEPPTPTSPPERLPDLPARIG